ILLDGLISPILVRPAGGHFELIAGERRVRAMREYTDWQAIEAKIIEIDDLGSRRISAAENIQREDLTVFEMIEAIVAIVDAELFDDPEYALMGDNSVVRVKTLLGKLHSVTNSKDRGSQISHEGELLLNRFIQQLEKIFEKLPKPLEWQSFYNNDLNLLVQAPQEVRDASVQHELNKSQTRALEKLHSVSEDQFRAFVTEATPSRGSENRLDGPPRRKRRLRDFSGAEIEAIAEKEIRKQTLAEQARSRETVRRRSKEKALLMNRLGIPTEIIASNLGINWRTAKKHGQDRVLFGAIQKALANGLAVPEVAEKHAVPEPLVWSVALEGKDDRDRFDALGWKIRTTDYWYWNNCDQRFGDDWPGRIPAQMIGHILYYFSDQGDLVFDPMSGGGVVPDTCLPFNRKCRSFDMEDRLDLRPEIETHFWDGSNLKWPIGGKDKPDLVIFDPPYFSKKSGDYDSRAISGMSRGSYLDFMKAFLSLTHRYTSPTCRIALINADWRDFQRTSARDELRENAILIREYLEILDASGWQETHIIQAPLSSERFTGNMVKAMQKRRTLGVISRYVIVARKLGKEERAKLREFGMSGAADTA
ncbi:MAG: ParB N-terminal domain-containing protein, partial [Desulfobacterales bacterium]